MSNQWNWWKSILAECRKDGEIDACRGVYDPPHDVGVAIIDPQDEDENVAYTAGWEEKRRELGQAFRWRE